jgi:hypothetical protein
MMQPRRLLFATSLSLFASPLWPLTLQPLKGTTAPLKWSGPQFIQANGQGEVFVLRGDPLQVYPVLKSHELGAPVELTPTVTSGPLLDAAMNRHGDWAVILAHEVHSFVDGKENESLPPMPWVPVAVGFLRGEPVVSVLPPPAGPYAPHAAGEAPPVLVRSWNGSWTAEMREALHGPVNDYNNERLFRAALILDDREGRYFMARQYAYRIDLRRSGRASSLEELRLGKGEPLLTRSSEQDTRRLLAQAKAEGSEVRETSAHGFHGALAVLALAQGGPGGHLYAVIGAGIAGDHCALDRIDWEAHRVERTRLDLPCNGRVSLAAGRDGLYFAKYNGQDGRYFASWESVNASEWTALKDIDFAP